MLVEQSAEKFICLYFLVRKKLGFQNNVPNFKKKIDFVVLEILGFAFCSAFGVKFDVNCRIIEKTLKFLVKNFFVVMKEKYEFIYI